MTAVVPGVAARPRACVQRWRKLGCIFEPPRHLAWMRSHAALPFAQHLRGNRYRIYFSGRDSSSRSRIGWFECDLARPREIIAISASPIVDPGPLGGFSDSGVTNSCMVAHEGDSYLYYTGWSLGVTVPFYYSIGLAISNDGGRMFGHHSDAPIMGRHDVDPYLCASPCVLHDSGRWRMWYVSGARWAHEQDRAKHYYHIKYAESKDGIEWKRTGHVCIDFASETEHAFGRPTVLREIDRYRMWYPYRGERYRIGYAESADGIHWTRMDGRAGIDVSERGWDSEMIAYPHVFRRHDRLYMLYNGNDYGRTGIGIAILEESNHDRE